MTQPAIVDSDFSDRSNQYVVVKGATDPYYEGRPIIDLAISSVYNSIFVSETSPIKIEIFKEFDEVSKVLSKQILAITDYTIPQADF